MNVSENGKKEDKTDRHTHTSHKQTGMQTHGRTEGQTDRQTRFQSQSLKAISNLKMYILFTVIYYMLLNVTDHQKVQKIFI